MDRTVKVSLIANVSNYVRGFDEADKANKKTRDSAAAAAAKLQAQREVMESTGRGALVFGGLIAAGIALAVSKYAEFDAAMSNVIATGDDARKNQDALRQAALDAGASTVFSATEAANAIEELAKAGVSARDILAGGLSGSLDLAAAGQLGVARAAEITSTALNQFELRGEKASHVADVLAAGAGKAMGSVDDLAQGLKFVGPVAASMGVSLEETTGVLALFAQQGIIGEQAGTSLRGVLASLTSPSAQARGEIERLGLTLYDQQGNFLGLENAAGQLSSAYSRMDGASRDASLGIIFGRETVTAATALYKAGASGVDEWTAAVDDSGYAAEVARQRLDNLKGDLEALSGAIDIALIQSGSTANDTLRAMVQIITELVNGYSDLPEPIQATVMIVGGATAAITLAGGAALLAVPKVVALKQSFKDAGISIGRTTLTAGAAGLALAGLTAVIGVLASKQAEMRAASAEFADSFDDATGAMTDYTRQLIATKLAESGAFDGAREAGIAQKELTDALYEGGSAYEDVVSRLREAHNASGGWNATIGNSINAVLDMNKQLSDARTRFKDVNEATDESAESSQSAADAYMEAADQAGGLADELARLVDQVNEANGIGQDAISSNIAYRDALAKVDEQIQKAREGQEGYAVTLDEGTQAGRDNLGMLNDLAARAIAAAKAQLELDGDTANYRATLESSRQALIDRAQQLGYNADQAAALADQILRIPSATEWDAIVQTANAQRALDGFFVANNGRRINVVVDATGGETYQIAGTTVRYRAAGGAIHGPGTSTSDSVPAMLSNGEHVWTAEEVARAGGHAAMYAMRAAVMGGRFARGGAAFVQPQYAQPAPVVMRAGRQITFAPVIQAAPGMDENALVRKAIRAFEEQYR